MGNKLLIIGESGSGKSTSTRTLDEKTTFYINCIGKPLPFRGWRAKYRDKTNYIECNKAEDVTKTMLYINKELPQIKTIIVDDAQYIMSFEFMARAMERGFDKFTEIAQHMFNVLCCPDKLRSDLTTVFLSHSEDVSGNGCSKTKMKTIGKMLDDKISIEGLFTIVLLAYPYKENKSMKYCFLTQSDGTTTAKSPMDMFDPIIENDLNLVLTKINKYNEGE